MMSNTSQSENRLRFAGIFLVMGLLIEALCLLWATPIAFIVFVAFGGLLILVGLAVYLHTQVSTAVPGD